MVQFTKLRLSGFKSFLYPTEIEIGRGKTGVVGPNGCGKSNLLEALGWVMGETSAKRLRGGAMDDVIFNGTNNKAARTNAEVTLWLDNSDRTAPAPFNDIDELEITRRIERGAGSDYQINGKNVRAKDVQLLFADLVSGANSPALVSQGRITAIINAKPKDRRRILEDAAGISGLHARRHEAELKLRATSTNLERLEDVIGTMESQLGSLKKQARQASRYRNLSDHIRNAEATLLYLKWQKADSTTKTAKVKFDEIEQQTRDKLQTTTVLSTKQAESAALLPDLRKQEAEAAAILQRFIIEKENLDQEENRIEQNKDQARESIERLSSDIEHEKSILAEQDERQTSLKEERTSLQDTEDNIDDLEDKAKEKLERLMHSLQKAESDYQTTVQNLASQTAEKNNLQNQKIGHDGQIASLNDEKASFGEQLETLEAKLNENGLFDGLQTQLEEAQKALDILKEKRDELEEQKLEAEIALSNARASYQTIQSTHTKIVAEAEALEDILGGDDEDDYTPVLDEIDVAAGYETALAAAFGEGLEYPTNEDALIYWSKRGNAKDDAPLPGGIASIAEHVKAMDALNRALNYVGIVESTEQGNKLSKDLQPGQILVTKQGDVWRWDGLTVKAEAPSTAAIRLKQKNRLADLLNDAKLSEKKLNKEKEALEKIEENLSKNTEKIREVKNEIAGAEQSQNEAREQLGSLQEELSDTKNQIVSIKTSLERIDQNLIDTQEKKQNVEQKLALLGDLQASEQEKEQQSDAIELLRNRVSEEQLAYNQLKRESDTRKFRLDQIEQELNNVDQTVVRSKTRLSELQTRLTASQEKLESLENGPDNISAKRDDLLNKIETAQTQRNEQANILQEAENILRDIEATLRAEESRLADLREQRATLQAGYQNATEQSNQLREEISEKFESQPEHILDALEINLDGNNLPSLEKTGDKLSRLIRERDNMGPVNLRADIEAQEITEEVEKLENEKEELIAAIHKLRGAISKLNREARSRLLEAFEKVNNHFQHLFTRLFGGGKAYLQLTDSDDPLDAGLEIYAQPPGKKLQALSLLSGGEQTLTSIALVFAMFLTNPSPICVLDEIDAALDDANIDRVCNLLDEMAAQGDTRFLVISHHRMTVARMDRLYGVTMAERGISQLVSVDLRQADLLEQEAA